MLQHKLIYPDYIYKVAVIRNAVLQYQQNALKQRHWIRARPQSHAEILLMEPRTMAIHSAVGKYLLKLSLVTTQNTYNAPNEFVALGEESEKWNANSIL